MSYFFFSDLVKIQHLISQSHQDLGLTSPSLCWHPRLVMPRNFFRSISSGAIVHGEFLFFSKIPSDLDLRGFNYSDCLPFSFAWNYWWVSSHLLKEQHKKCLGPWFCICYICLSCIGDPADDLTHAQHPSTTELYSQALYLNALTK